MENLHSDLIALNTELNARDVPCNLGMLGDRLNQSTSSRTPVEHWYDSITEQQVYDLYREDFQNFQYARRCVSENKAA